MSFRVTEIVKLSTAGRLIKVGDESTGVICTTHRMDFAERICRAMNNEDSLTEIVERAREAHKNAQAAELAETDARIVFSAAKSAREVAEEAYEKADAELRRRIYGE